MCVCFQNSPSLISKLIYLIKLVNGCKLFRLVVMSTQKYFLYVLLFHKAILCFSKPRNSLKLELVTSLTSKLFEKMPSFW